MPYFQVDNGVQYHDLPVIDRHALFQLENVVKNIRESYENYQFFKIFQVIFLKYCWYSVGVMLEV